MKNRILRPLAYTMILSILMTCFTFPSHAEKVYDKNIKSVASIRFPLSAIYGKI